MALRIELEEEAETDLRAAARHYAEIDPELAERFIAGVESLLELVSTQPEMGRNYADVATRTELANVQWFPLRDFPYLVFWSHDSEQVSVWAVAEAHQDLPAILRKRFG